MFILRSVHASDLQSLYELSKIQVFINLPANLEQLKEKISHSEISFKTPDDDMSNNYYIFVLEEIETGKIIGTSMIHGKHGTLEEPHFFLTVGTENKYSETMHIGYIHKTLKLGLETNGWTEIGGLVLDPEHRGSKDKLGKQLSYIRFLFMGMFPGRFTEVIHTELMPPFDDEGNSPLWEAIGRRFLHMDYNDADQRSRKSKEFILSLFPSDTIYESLLPLEARRSIGEVGETTKPVKKMLEKIGFKYMNEVDPFDGGPHYRAKLKDISLVKNMIKGKLNFAALDVEKAKDMLISVQHPQHDFFAFKCKGIYDAEGGLIKIEQEFQEKLELKLGATARAIYF